MLSKCNTEQVGLECILIHVIAVLKCVSLLGHNYLKGTLTVVFAVFEGEVLWIIMLNVIIIWLINSEVRTYLMVKVFTNSGLFKMMQIFIKIHIKHSIILDDRMDLVTNFGTP